LRGVFRASLRLATVLQNEMPLVGVGSGSPASEGRQGVIDTIAVRPSPALAAIHRLWARSGKKRAPKLLFKVSADFAVSLAPLRESEIAFAGVAVLKDALAENEFRNPEAIAKSWAGMKFELRARPEQPCWSLDFGNTDGQRTRQLEGGAIGIGAPTPHLLAVLRVELGKAFRGKFFAAPIYFSPQRVACGKKLDVPVSQLRCLGPVCAGDRTNAVRARWKVKR
jgi:hypothetical protein